MSRVCIYVNCGRDSLAQKAVVIGGLLSGLYHARFAEQLCALVKELAERYETPLPMLTDKVAELSEKVAAHLKKMGFQP